MDNHLRTMKDRILQLRTARFYDLSESVLRFQSTVIHTLDYDEAGQIWFTLPKPSQRVSEFDTSFPLQLNYFKKDSSHSLLILGKGYIVHDPEEMNNWLLLYPGLSVTGEDSILVKMKPSRAEFQEWEPVSSLLERAFHNLLSWSNMLGSGKRTYEFEPSC